MKKQLFLLTLMAGALCADAATLVNKYGTDTEVCDPVLIYTGGLAKRADWTQARNIRPYLTHGYADGSRDWFYDAFIYNETEWTDNAAGETRVLVNAGGGQKPAVKADWDAYFDQVFNKDLPALDKQISTWKETLGEPRLRHKVIIGIPFACKDGRDTPKQCEWKKFNFGTIDGVDMNFANIEHRIIAGKYAVDEVLRRFEAGNFKNFDLAGIYCPEETMYTVGDFVRDINDYAHSKNLHTYWVPYWANNDQYALEWEKYGFDICYRQPNYFFYATPLPTKRQLRECIEISKQYGCGLELEFETSNPSNALNETSPAYHQRLVDYIDYFEQYGVWAESGVAHYGGSKGYIDMASSPDPVNQATMDRLANLVRERQKRFAGIADSPELPQVPFAFAGEGKIVISGAPEAAVYTLSGMAVFHGEGTFECAPGIYIATDGRGRSVKVAVR